MNYKNGTFLIIAVIAVVISVISLGVNFTGNVTGSRTAYRPTCNLVITGGNTTGTEVCGTQRDCVAIITSHTEMVPIEKVYNTTTRIYDIKYYYFTLERFDDSCSDRYSRDSRDRKVLCCRPTPTVPIL